jgi:hypothetical protein
VEVAATAVRHNGVEVAATVGRHNGVALAAQEVELVLFRVEVAADLVLLQVQAQLVKLL